MKPLHIHSFNDYTPTIDFNADTGVLHFSGTCLMRHIWQVSCPILEWTKQYLDTQPRHVVVEFQLDTFNVVTTKFLWNFFQKLEQYYKRSGNQVTLYWNFDETDFEMKKIYEEFQKAFAFPIENASFMAVEVA